MRYLVALNEHRHFGRAAEACHITQPALSNALRALEEAFGATIVRRGRVYAGLTPEGEGVLASAQRMLREQELLEQDLRSGADRPCGHLVIGAVPTAVPVAARFAARLRAAQPGIVPVVRSLTSHEIETGLEALTLDLGLGYTARPGRGRVRQDVLVQYDERYCLLEPTPRGAAVGPSVTWQQAAQRPLCLLTPDMHHRTLIDQAFKAAGSAPQPVMESDSVVALAVSVQAGGLCSVLPVALVALAGLPAGVRACPLPGPEPAAPVGFLTPADAPPTRVLAAALAFASSPDWREDLGRHTTLPAR